MKFVVDARLPPFLCAWLAARGHEARLVLDMELQTATDAEIAAIVEKGSAV